MWDGLLLLLGYCVVMGVASFLAGLLPLSFGLSQNYTRIISSLGTGLLVGACLTIIIPEGIETLYSAGEHYYEIERGPGADYAGELYEPHGKIGIALIAGFILMFCIDRLPQLAARHANPKRPLTISLANLSQGPHRAPSPLPAGASDGPADSLIAPPVASDDDSPNTARSISRGVATTVGLVIHAIADGIALAASTFIAHPRTGFIVFVALMFHKAPAAFGLTSVLIKQGLSKRQARTHLLLFSLAAPLGAIATWLFVRTVLGANVGEFHTRFATGMLLLFSGGTFLYVAMHTVQESNVNTPHSHSHHHTPHHAADDASGTSLANGNPYATAVEGSGNRGAVQGPTFRDTALGITGMLLPLLAHIGHAH